PMDLERPLPNPMTPECKPYWEGARDGKLMIPKCRACGKPFMYPRVACPFCASRDIGWGQATGRGRLFSFEIAHQILKKAFKVKTPVVLAMVELEEGPRILSNLLGIAPDPKQIRCDMPVEVCFEKLTDEISLPMFRPAGGARWAASRGWGSSATRSASWAWTRATSSAPCRGRACSPCTSRRSPTPRGTPASRC